MRLSNNFTIDFLSKEFKYFLVCVWPFWSFLFYAASAASSDADYAAAVAAADAVAAASFSAASIAAASVAAAKAAAAV